MSALHSFPTSDDLRSIQT